MSRSALKERWGQGATELTESQVQALNAIYMQDPYPSTSVRLSLSLQLGITPQHIGRWFARRLLKDQKERGEQTSKYKAKTVSQLKILNDFFELNHFPSTKERLELANETHLEASQVRSWFQNERVRRGVASQANLRPGLRRRREVEESMPEATRLQDLGKMRKRLILKEVWTAEMEQSWESVTQGDLFATEPLSDPQINYLPTATTIPSVSPCTILPSLELLTSSSYLSQLAAPFDGSGNSVHSVREDTVPTQSLLPPSEHASTRFQPLTEFSGIYPTDLAEILPDPSYSGSFSSNYAPIRTRSA